MASKTVRRDRLLRLAKAGRLVSCGSYSYDELTGEHRGTADLPVRIIASNAEWKDGYCNLRESAFTSSVGHASADETGRIWLYIHSNSNVTLRELAAGETPPVPQPR